MANIDHKHCSKDAQHDGKDRNKCAQWPSYRKFGKVTLRPFFHELIEQHQRARTSTNKECSDQSLIAHFGMRFHIFGDSDRFK